MHESIRVIPGPGPYRGAHGPWNTVLANLPALRENAVRRAEHAEPSTRDWLSEHPMDARKALSAIEDEPFFDDWASRHMELFWVPHVQTFRALFNEGYLPEIARVLKHDESVLRRIHERSESEKIVRQWIKQRGKSEEARLAERAWLLATIIRGRYHEYLAREKNLQLSAHPIRKPAELDLPSETALCKNLTNTERFFIRILIGSALNEKNILKGGRPRRAQVWAENLRKARLVLYKDKKFNLPQLDSAEDAESHAALVAMEAGLSSSSAVSRRAIDVCAGLALSLPLMITVLPWPATPLIAVTAVQTYRHIRGASPGEDIARVVHTRRRFRKLGRQVPGRISGHLWTG